MPLVRREAQESARRFGHRMNDAHPLQRARMIWRVMKFCAEWSVK